MKRESDTRIPDTYPQSLKLVLMFSISSRVTVRFLVK